MLTTIPCPTEFLTWRNAENIWTLTGCNMNASDAVPYSSCSYTHDRPQDKAIKNNRTFSTLLNSFEKLNTSLQVGEHCTWDFFSEKHTSEYTYLEAMPKHKISKSDKLHLDFPGLGYHASRENNRRRLGWWWLCVFLDDATSWWWIEREAGTLQFQTEKRDISVCNLWIGVRICHILYRRSCIWERESFDSRWSYTTDEVFFQSNSKGRVNEFEAITMYSRLCKLIEIIYESTANDWNRFTYTK